MKYDSCDILYGHAYSKNVLFIQCVIVYKFVIELRSVTT